MMVGSVNAQQQPKTAAGAFDPIIFVLEGDTLLVGRDQPAIGDRDAIGIARQITIS